MLNQVSLPRTGPSIDVAQVGSAVHRGLLALGVLRPTRRSGPTAWQSYLEDGLMKREMYRL